MSLLGKDRDALERLRDAWAARWSDALALWSRFTQLAEPRWCLSSDDERSEELVGSFAMIRLVDHAVVISLDQVRRRGLEGFPLEIMGHEIGHHVYCPADLTDHARLIARTRRALPTKEHLAGLVANLYTDLLINDRLQRGRAMDMAGVYRKLLEGPADRLWTLILRAYEILWSLPRRTLAVGDVEPAVEGDAQLGSRIVRVYAKDWLRGAGRFAALCLPYLLQKADMNLLRGWHDTRSAGAGGQPGGLVEADDDEEAGAIHPALDPELSGVGDGEDPGAGDAPGTREPGPPATIRSGGQCREPFEYGEILRSAGVVLDDHEIAVRYYRERALPHLVPFPSIEKPESTEPLPEGLEPWSFGESLDRIDWFESILSSPRVVPGLTTAQRVYGTTEGTLPEREPLDLDLYVDSSGSMPNPQVETSYLALAGAIVALSALRAGARVQATLWSGTRQFKSTPGFVTDETAVLRILTGCFGGSTAFPIHVLRDTFADRKPSDPRVHVLVVSDEGVTTMFDKDEKGNSGYAVSSEALKKAGGGGTWVLNLPVPAERHPEMARARKAGWSVFRVAAWEDLVAFARAFSRAAYASESEAPGHA